MSKTRNIFFTCLLILLIGCVNKIEDIENPNIKELDYDFVDLKEVKKVENLEEKSILFEISLNVDGKDITVYGDDAHVSLEEISDISTFDEIELIRKEDGKTYLVDYEDVYSWKNKIFLQVFMYWLFLFLNLFLPYVVAHSISYIGAIIGLLLLVLGVIGYMSEKKII